MFGTVLLAGFFRKLVGQAHGGGGVVTVRRIVRTLPFARLVAADTLGRRPRDLRSAAADPRASDLQMS